MQENIIHRSYLSFKGHELLEQRGCYLNYVGVWRQNSCALTGKKKVKKDKQTWKEKKLSFQRWKMQTFVQQKGIQALSPKRFTNVARDRLKLINMLWTLGQGKVLDLCYTIFHISFKARKVQDKTTKVIWCKEKWQIKHWTAQSSSAEHQISCWTLCSYLFLGYHQQLSHQTPWQEPHFEKCLGSITWN